MGKWFKEFNPYIGGDKVLPLSTRSQPYIIPEYSLTGDLLSYQTCGLQYRYYNRGSLPPSKPVQLWFGEFIHGVMEEAYREWQQNPNKRSFPWSWKPDVREIELRINERLRARGLNPPPRLFCPYGASYGTGWCSDANHPHKLIASQRAEMAINIWGQYLFPLIEEAEVRLKGIRNMPDYQAGRSRCNYYSITGVVDVISSITLQYAQTENLILHYIHQNPQIQRLISNFSDKEYEIIIDYKGMRRPSIIDSIWKRHEWQILTYAWLRSKQPKSRPIVAGIIFYINELVLSQEDLKELRNDVTKKITDVTPQEKDLQAIRSWKEGTMPPILSDQFRIDRSIRVIPIDYNRIQDSLREFDKVVSEIESCVLSEMSTGNIISSWPPVPNERNCTACDFKTFCPKPAPRKYYPTVP